MTVEQQIKDCKKLLGLNPGCRIVCKRKKKVKKPVKAKVETKVDLNKKLLEDALEKIKKQERISIQVRQQIEPLRPRQVEVPVRQQAERVPPRPRQQAERVEVPVRQQAEQAPPRPRQQAERIEVPEPVRRQQEYAPMMPIQQVERVDAPSRRQVEHILIEEALADSLNIVEQKEVEEEQKQQEIDNRVNIEIQREIADMKEEEIKDLKELREIDNKLVELEKEEEDDYEEELDELRDIYREKEEEDKSLSKAAIKELREERKVKEKELEQLKTSKITTEQNIALRMANINHKLNELEKNKEDLEESLNHIDRRSAEGKKIRDVIKDVEHRMDIEREKLAELNEDIHLISGSGKVGTGMTDHELDEIMKDEPHYQKCISIDEIDTLKPEPIMEFIMNKSPSTSEGSHWVSCYIDTKGDKSIEYYDPLADPPQEQFIHDIKKYVIDELDPDTLLKFKINKVINQRNDSDSCGLMCVNFLKKRNRGISFKDSTGYLEPHINNTKKYEAEASKIRTTAGFGYL